MKFLETYRTGGADACLPMLMMGLSGALAGYNVKVYVARMHHEP